MSSLAVSNPNITASSCWPRLRSTRIWRTRRAGRQRNGKIGQSRSWRSKSADALSFRHRRDHTHPVMTSQSAATAIHAPRWRCSTSACGKCGAGTSASFRHGLKLLAHSISNGGRRTPVGALTAAQYSSLSGGGSRRWGRCTSEPSRQSHERLAALRLVV